MPFLLMDYKGSAVSAPIPFIVCKIKEKLADSKKKHGVHVVVPLLRLLKMFPSDVIR